MKRLILILLLLIVLPCLAADWRVTVKVEKTPADTSGIKLKIHHAKKDSVQVDVWQKLQEAGIKGWAIIDNKNGTQYVATVPDTIPIVGPIRSALGKYNKYVTVRKVKVEEE